MAKRVLDYDPLTRITTWHDYDWLTDTTTISNTQDVDPIIEGNKALRGIDGLGQKQRKNDWWLVGRIPLMLIDKWLREDNLDVFRANHDPEMWRRLKRKLNDPEYAYLRPTQGRV
jgi:hypothetical protein